MAVAVRPSGKTPTSAPDRVRALPPRTAAKYCPKYWAAPVGAAAPRPPWRTRGRDAGRGGASMASRARRRLGGDRPGAPGAEPGQAHAMASWGGCPTEPPASGPSASGPSPDQPNAGPSLAQQVSEPRTGARPGLGDRTVAWVQPLA